MKEAVLILARPDDRARLEGLLDVIAGELNVKTVRFADNAADYVSHEIVANFKAIGPKYRQDVKAIKQALADLDGSAAHAELTDKQIVTAKLPDKSIELTPDEVQVRLSAREGYVASQGTGGVVILNTELDDDLIDEGLARDINNRVQGLRRELDLPYEARVRLAIAGSEKLVKAARAHADYLKEEALAEELLFEAPDWDGAEKREFEIGDETITLWLARV